MNITTLKNALLYFDCAYFLSPISFLDTQKLKTSQHKQRFHYQFLLLKT